MKVLTVICLAMAWILAGNGGDWASAGESPGGVVDAAAYRGADRRDPFVRPGSPPGADARSCGARGLEAVRARDLALRGIVKTTGGFLALLVGPDAVAHVARVGERLCDAKIGSIDPDGVTLEGDTGSGNRGSGTRTARLRLHAE